MGKTTENVEKCRCFLRIIARKFRLNANEPLQLAQHGDRVSFLLNLKTANHL